MKKRWPSLLVLISLVSFTGAQSSEKPADNAALRYWMAFAQMNDSQISHAEAMRMDAMISGGSAWNEQEFGAIVEKNKAAIETMIRGSQLPYCDWGLETDLGPAMPFEHIPKARAIARLNSMYAMRLASHGDDSGAVRATIAGIRFGQHLGQNASFLGALTAKAALIPALLEAQALANDPHLHPRDRAALREVVKAIPEGGLNWSSAVRVEAQQMHWLLTEMSQPKHSNPALEKYFDDVRDLGRRAPTKKEIEQTDAAMEDYEKFLGMSPEHAQAQLPILQKEISALDPTSKEIVPNPARTIEARTVIVKVQRKARTALGIP